MRGAYLIIDESDISAPACTNSFQFGTWYIKIVPFQTIEMEIIFKVLS